MKLHHLWILLLLCGAETAPAQAVDTLVTFSGERIPATGTRQGIHSFFYTDPATHIQRETNASKVYFVRFADGRSWPAAIGRFRQRRFIRNVRRHTGDTLLARELFPLRHAPFDTITTMDGVQIPAYHTQRRPPWIRFNDAADSSRRRIPARAAYSIRFSNGDIWPAEHSGIRRRSYAEQTAKRTDDWKGYLKQYQSSRNYFLLCAPVFHQSGKVPGISTGIAFDSFVDSAARFSVGGTVSYMWAGTFESGKYNEGDRRTNVHANILGMSCRYHVLDQHGSADPFLGMNVAVGSYRSYDQWMTRGQLYTDKPATYFLFAPQLELGLNLSLGRATVLQFVCAAGPQLVGGRLEGSFCSLGLLRFGFRF